MMKPLKFVTVFRPTKHSPADSNKDGACAISPPTKHDALHRHENRSSAERMHDCTPGRGTLSSALQLPHRPNFARAYSLPSAVNKASEGDTRLRVKLADRETMRCALRAVNDSPHIQEKLYARWLDQAGTQQFVFDVVILLTGALSRYAKEFPAGMRGVFWRQQHYFLRALIAHDGPALREAEAILNSMKPAISTLSKH